MHICLEGFIYDQLALLDACQICNPMMALFMKHIDGFVQERRNSIVNTLQLRLSCTNPSIDGFVQKRRNSIANALELRLSCINPSM